MTLRHPIVQALAGLLLGCGLTLLLAMSAVTTTFPGASSLVILLAIWCASVWLAFDRVTPRVFFAATAIAISITTLSGVAVVYINLGQAGP